ncbi:hypothetical protein ACQUSR_13720 [Streptomyces sp. P1-3]|uniref:DUF7848 domain-containing protein n=1 Tax=Streptomyces sp. P1-3 TaxID=3421658 RepID=UPI003D35F3DF
MAVNAGLIVKGAEWVLSAETAEGAPEGIFGAQCIRCGEEVWMDNDRRPVQAWMIDHTRGDPAHAQFRFTVERFCRVDPAPATPASGPGHTVLVPAGMTSRRPPGSRAHALPRPARRPASVLRRALARAGRCAGRYAEALLLVFLAPGRTRSRRKE